MLGVSLVVVSEGYSLVAEHGLLIVVAALVAKHRLSDAQFWHRVSVAVALRPWSTQTSVIAACRLSSGSLRAFKHRLSSCDSWA